MKNTQIYLHTQGPTTRSVTSNASGRANNVDEKREYHTHLSVCKIPGYTINSLSSANAANTSANVKAHLVETTCASK